MVELQGKGEGGQRLAVGGWQQGGRAAGRGENHVKAIIPRYLLAEGGEAGMVGWSGTHSMNLAASPGSFVEPGISAARSP